MSSENEDKRIIHSDVRTGKYISDGEFHEIPDDLDSKIEFESVDSIITDTIDEIIAAEGISEGLAEALDLGSELTLEKKETELKEALAKAEFVNTTQNTALKQEIIDSVFVSPELKEQYFKNMASLLYREIHSKAKLFLKDWAFTNGYRQKWRNPFLKEFSVKNLTPLSEFIPQVYNLSMIHVDTGDEVELAAFEPTPREATVHGAKKLGFDSSNYRQKAFAKFSKEVRDMLLLKDERYLRETRILHIYEEHRRQIQMRRYVNSGMRDKWLKEIEKDLNQSTTRIV